MAAEELVERLIRVMDRMSIQTGRPAIEDWPDIELTMPQLRALAILNHGPLRMGDLGAALGSSLPATTSMVERLEGKGLAKRITDQADRRAVQCHLTESGTRHIERFWRVKRQQVVGVADVLSVEEMTVVVAAMEMLSSALMRHERRARTPVAAQPEAK